MLKCEVHPMGRGYLTWRRDGNRLKYEKLVSELELETSTAGDYHCHGNLTLGGYTYFTSNAYATGIASRTIFGFVLPYELITYKSHYQLIP